MVLGGEDRMIELHLKIDESKVLINKFNAPEGCLQSDFAIMIYLLEQYKRDLINAEFSGGYQTPKETEPKQKKEEKQKDKPETRGYLG